MIVEICTKSLKDFGITADEYLYLSLLHSGSHDVIDDLKLVVRLEVLQTKGLVKLGEIKDHVVRAKFSTRMLLRSIRCGLTFSPTFLLRYT